MKHCGQSIMVHSGFVSFRSKQFAVWRNNERKHVSKHFKVNVSTTVHDFRDLVWLGEATRKSIKRIQNTDKLIFGAGWSKIGQKSYKQLQENI